MAATTKKGKTLYKVITTFTLLAPTVIYLFIAAALFGITPDYSIENVTSEQIVTYYGGDWEDDQAFIFSQSNEAVYDGVVVYQSGHYGFIVDSEDIVQLDDGYFSWNSESHTMQDIEEQAEAKNQSYSISIAFVASIIGIGIVALLVSKKMSWQKQHPRAAVLIALITGTAVLYLINAIVGSLLNVFMIATVSWAAYYIEWLIQQRKISSADGEKKESDLLHSLKEALK